MRHSTYDRMKLRSSWVWMQAPYQVIINISNLIFEEFYYGMLSAISSTAPPTAPLGSGHHICSSTVLRRLFLWAPCLIIYCPPTAPLGTMSARLLSPDCSSGHPPYMSANLLSPKLLFWTACLLIYCPPTAPLQQHPNMSAHLLSPDCSSGVWALSCACPSPHSLS